MKLLLVGPTIFPIHGQSLAFSRFEESICESDKIVVDTNLECKSKITKIIYSIFLLFEIMIKTLFFKYEKVYFTCSRSIFGSFKDVILINIAAYRKKKIVNHLHGSDFYEFFHASPRWYRYILAHTYHKVDVSIVLLERMREQFRDFPNMRVEIVPNFYDEELEVSLITKSRKKVNFVYLSNIMMSKGVFELIESFKDISADYDHVSLSIAGEFMSDASMNFEETKLKFISEISGINNISYLGKVYGEEKIKLLQRSDIFVLPSYYVSEALPISIIEAMACGNAIITSNHKYLPDLISESNGLLAEPKSVSSLSECFRTLLMDLSLVKKMQRYNTLHAKKMYSLDKYIKKLKGIIESC